MSNQFFKTVDIRPGVKKIIGAVQEGMFLIEGKEKALLFDTGIGCGNLRDYAGTLTELPIAYVVLSHGHADHAGGIGDFKHIWISPEDISLMQENSSVEVRYELLKSIEAQHNARYPFLKNDFQEIGDFELATVKEGDFFDLGERILEVINVPGHTQGSIALLDRENRILFSGDAFNQSTFVWGDESSTLTQYAGMLNEHLKKWKGTYDILCGAHDDCPDPASLVEDVLEAVNGVLEGRYNGAPYTFGDRKDLFLAKPPREGNIGCADGRKGNVVFSYKRI